MCMRNQRPVELRTSHSRGLPDCITSAIRPSTSDTSTLNLMLSMGRPTSEGMRLTSDRVSGVNRRTLRCESTITTGTSTAARMFERSFASLSSSALRVLSSSLRVVSSSFADWSSSFALSSSSLVDCSSSLAAMSSSFTVAKSSSAIWCCSTIDSRYCFVAASSSRSRRASPASSLSGSSGARGAGDRGSWKITRK